MHAVRQQDHEEVVCGIDPDRRAGPAGVAKRTERKMVCTLVDDKIPSEKAPKNTGKSNSDEAIAVFDVEKQEWRSFRFDSIRSVVWNIDQSIEFRKGM